MTQRSSASNITRMDFARITWKIRMKNLLFFTFRFSRQLGRCRSTAQPVYVNWNPSHAEKLHGRGQVFHNSH
jgi:hypothetical protein